MNREEAAMKEALRIFPYTPVTQYRGGKPVTVDYYEKERAAYAAAYHAGLLAGYDAGFEAGVRAAAEVAKIHKYDTVWADTESKDRLQVGAYILTIDKESILQLLKS